METQRAKPSEPHCTATNTATIFFDSSIKERGNNNIKINDAVKINGRKRKLLKNRLDDTKQERSAVIIDYQKLVSCVATDGQLGDEHINAANQLLRSQFPDIQGLRSPVVGQRFCFPTFDIVLGYAGFCYFQVLHTGACHWVTIQVLSDEEVHVYDSMYLRPTFCTLKQIASIVKSKQTQLKIFLERVQCQKNTVDCGIYAIAYLTDLCHGEDPSTKKYSGSKELRKHLIHCFEQGVMSPFPSTASQKELRPLRMDLNIYCSCRLLFVLEHMEEGDVPPEDCKKMIQCDFCNRWYHCSCVEISCDECKRIFQAKCCLDL